MKKVLFAIVITFAAVTLCSASASGQSVSVSVNLKTIFMTPDTGNSQVCATLNYPNARTVPLSPVIPGVGTITKIETQCKSPDGSGVVSFNLPGNDVIKIGGQTGVTFYTIEFYADGQFVHGANYTLNVADSPVDLSLKTPLNVIPVVAAPTGDSTYCRLDGGNCGFSGPIHGPNSILTITGSETAAAHNTSTRGDRQIILQNPDFEGSTLIPPPGWTFWQSPTLSYETVSPAPNKNQSLKISTTNVADGVVSVSRVSVAVGDTYSITCQAKSDGSGVAACRLLFEDKTGSVIGAGGTPATTTSTSWTMLTYSSVVPAGAVFAQVFLQTIGGTQPGTVWFDQISVQKTSFGALNGDFWVGSAPGQYASMAACYTAISSGQVCHVTAGWSETFSANLVLSKSNTGFVFHGAATITMGTNQIIINAGLSNPFIVGLGGVDPAGVGTPLVKFVYTGSGTAMPIGGASRVAGLRLENFDVDLTGAGSSAIAINYQDVSGGCLMQGVGINGAGGAISQIGIQLDNGGNFTGDCTFKDDQITNVQTGILLNGSTLENTFVGVQLSLGATASVGYDFEGGAGNAGNVITGGNINGYTTPLKFAGSSTNNLASTTVGSTTAISFGASTSNNTVFDVSNASPTVTWGGTNNRVFYNGKFLNTGLLNQQGALSPIVGNGADQNIYTFTIPAGTVGPGQCLRVEIAWIHSTGTASINYKFIIGGTTLKSYSYANFDNNHMEVQKLRVCNNSGVMNAQNWLWDGSQNLAGQTLDNLVGPATLTSAINFANQQVFQWTFNVAATDQLTPEFFLVELIQ